MFEPLKKLCSNVKNLKSEKLLIGIIADNQIQHYILDLNRFDQLFKEGINANGEYLGNYSYFTDSVRRGESFSYGGLSSKKTINDHITLYDTGKFYKSMFVRLYKDGFTIVANTITDDGTDLASEERYGADIIGLSDESIEKLFKKITPILVKNIRETILKGVL